MHSSGAEGAMLPGYRKLRAPPTPCSLNMRTLTGCIIPQQRAGRAPSSERPDLALMMNVRLVISSLLFLELLSCPRPQPGDGLFQRQNPLPTTIYRLCSYRLTRRQPAGCSLPHSLYSLDITTRPLIAWPNLGSERNGRNG